jgi:uroporphyrinogen-III synthase
LLTRPQAQAKRFAALCRARLSGRAEIMISPILRIDLLPVGAPPQATLIFSSENAVHAAARGGLTQRVAYCVGDRTAQVARDAGFDARSARGAAQDLIALITEEAPRGPLLYLHGETVRVDVAAALRALGHDAQAQVAYRQVAQPLTDKALGALQGAAPVVLPLFSPRSAKLLSAPAKSARAPLYPVALSPQVAAAWQAPHSALHTADHPDGAHMLDTLTVLLRDTLP